MFEEKEYQNFLKWYKYSNEDKLRNIRDIYQLNILNTKYYKDIIIKLVNKGFKEIPLKNELTCIVNDGLYEDVLYQLRINNDL